LQHARAFGIRKYLLIIVISIKRTLVEEDDANPQEFFLTSTPKKSGAKAQILFWTKSLAGPLGFEPRISGSPWALALEGQRAIPATLPERCRG